MVNSKLTEQDLTTIQWAIDVLEIYEANYPDHPLPVIPALKELKGRLLIKNGKVIKESQTQEFIRIFGEVYKECTGHIYKTDKKHFILVNGMIKKYGLDAVSDKAQILAFYCREGKSWFARDGWSNFTVETLSNRWNNLLPQRRLSPEEVKDQKYQSEVKKWEDHDAAIKSAIERSRTDPSGNGTGTPSHTPR